MSKTINKEWIWGAIAAILTVVAGVTGAAISINIENGKTNATITYSEEEVPATIVDDRGQTIETTEYNGEEIPTVEEVDGEEQRTETVRKTADFSDETQFELLDNMAEELISLAIIMALENVESTRLNTKINMRGLES